jgi:hypothetical protein
VRGRALSPLLLGLLLGGCSFAGSLQLGDVTLALHEGFAAFGTHVALAIR